MYSQRMLTVASRVDAMNRLGRAMADETRSRILLSLPGERPRTLAMSVLIDVAPASEALARQLMPRLSDAFTTFLADIDPAAFERRGILDIVRLELATRARFVLGEAAVRDLLITEYRIQ